MKKRLNDILFNGYVREPIPMVVIPVFVGICFFILALLCTRECLVTNSYKTTFTSGNLVSYKEDGPIFTLIVSDNFSYDIPKSAVNNEELFDRLMYSQEEILIEYVSASESMKRRDIISLSDESGKPYISSDIIEKAQLINSRNSLIFMWVSCAAYWALSLLSYYFICNAPKYPKIAALLVRKEFRYF